MWSELSDTVLRLRRLLVEDGEPKLTRDPSGAELGDPRCDWLSSNSSSDCFSQPFCTFTMAYERRVLSCAESCIRVSQPQIMS